MPTVFLGLAVFYLFRVCPLESAKIEYINPSPLSSDDVMSPGRPLLLKCNADVLNISDTVKFIKALEFSWAKEDNSEKNIVFQWNPFSAIGSKPKSWIPDGRNWIFAHSQIPQNKTLSTRSLSAMWTLNDPGRKDAGIYQCGVQDEAQTVYTGQQVITFEGKGGASGAQNDWVGAVVGIIAGCGVTVVAVVSFAGYSYYRKGGVPRFRYRKKKKSISAPHPSRTSRSSGIESTAV
ncbi:hypothetical protein ElyMa_003003700 [Elysia marginata]|uniref:Ig-like domain-containing protein n=1 Tax=Elysia marginata TaxID=1093978 RepID=A0AAV4IFZ5_9GAST|nr:hypothetical protein ElyMa_003003700 [Elysia marginata]